MINYAVIRGTSPTFRFKVSNYDVEKMEEIHVTFRQNDTILTKEDYFIEKNVEDNRIDVLLTQEETLMFSDGIVLCQIRILSIYDDAFATKVFEITWNKVLEEGVIR